MAEANGSDGDQEMDRNQFQSGFQSESQKLEFERKLKECRDLLSQYPADYTANLNYVQCLSQSTDHHVQYKRAWNRMRVRFAIPPSTSMQLIAAEINNVRAHCGDQDDGRHHGPTKEQILEIMGSFKAASSDYTMSIDLWTEYINFAFANKAVLGITFIRHEVMQDAVQSIGQHFVDGAKVCDVSTRGFPISTQL